MSSKNNTIVITYVPTPHAGYLKFFRKYAEGTLYILGNEFIKEFPALVRHLPGVTPQEACEMIRALEIFSRVHIFTVRDLCSVRRLKKSLIIMPDEDVSHAIAKKYFAGMKIKFDDRWRLRWDWGATQTKRRPEGERVVSKKALDRYFMINAFVLANKSPDWWRQIGALLVRNGQVLLGAFNQHVPSEQSAYCSGDPRSNFEQGQCIDASIALHAEAAIIAEAANRGLSMNGCDLYVTTFPCPPCAYSCARTGIRRLLYVDGYSLVAGAEELHRIRE